MEFNHKSTFKALLLIVLSLFLLFSVAFANGAKPMQDPAGNGGLIFDENPGIALLNETISFHLSHPENLARSVVTVEYEMKNLLESDQDFEMFFVIPPFWGSQTEIPFKVYLDGVDVTKASASKDMEGPNNWQPKFPKGLVEPYSKEIYDTNMQDDTGMGYKVYPKELTGISIPIFIKANSTTKLHVEYNCVGGFNRRPQFLNTIYNYLYYLTPAKYWNQEPKVTLNVTLPDTQDYVLHSNIPMESISNSSYTATLDSLPDTEWVFSFIAKAGLIYGTNSSKSHAQITFFISLALFAIGLLAAWRLKKRTYIRLGYIFSVAYFYRFKGIIVDGYIGEFLLMVPISIILILIIPIMEFRHHKHKIES